MNTLFRKKKIWISVDGGGTEARFCACNENNELLFNKSYGSTNYKTASYQVAKDNLTQGIVDLVETLEIERHEIIGTVVGVSGCDTEEDKKVYIKILKDLEFLCDRFYVCNDTELAFRAISNTKGLCVVAGTGSIVTAYDDNQLVDRVGGWGSPLSDLGSGYWIGAQILSKLIRWLDGMNEDKLPIYDDIVDQYSYSNEVLQWRLSKLSTNEVAAISELVFSYANSGNLVCKNIVKSSAMHISDLIISAYSKANFDGVCTIVTVGGLFKDPLYLSSVKSQVMRSLGQESLRFLIASKSPAEEGLKYARKRFQQSS
jgi:N-acetylglucosamine kinase-like BadF-type ATPase